MLQELIEVNLSWEIKCLLTVKVIIIKEEDSLWRIGSPRFKGLRGLLVEEVEIEGEEVVRHSDLVIEVVEIDINSEI